MIADRFAQPGHRGDLGLAIGGVLAAAATGVLLGAGSSLAPLLIGTLAAVVGLALPLGTLAALSVGVAMLFRLAAPNATGPISVVPDALILLVVLRAGAAAAVRGSEALPRPIRWAAALMCLIGVVALASSLSSGDSPIALVGAIRTFLRFPLWMFALALANLSWRQARGILAVILSGSVLQVALALWQYRAFGAGDHVSGTFGAGGSGVMMVFLVLAVTLWVALALERSIAWWPLLVVVPALVLPMGLGSAAMFVVFLPLDVLVLLVRWLTSRNHHLRFGVLATLTMFLAVGGFAATRYAVAPPCSGCRASAATSIYSNRYLSDYYSESLREGPDSRLGFLFFAARMDVEAGPAGILLGRGPGLSFLGAGSSAGRRLELRRYTSLQSRSVQSVQRVLLGLGFVALLAYAAMILVAGCSPRLRGPGVQSPSQRAVVLALPAATLVMLLAGPYTAAWSDPGVASAFWGLVLLGHIASRSTTRVG